MSERRYVTIGFDSEVLALVDEYVSLTRPRIPRNLAINQLLMESATAKLAGLRSQESSEPDR